MRKHALLARSVQRRRSEVTHIQSGRILHPHINLLRGAGMFESLPDMKEKRSASNKKEQEVLER